MEYAAEMDVCGMMYIPSFMVAGTEDETIIRSCLRNVKGSIIYISVSMTVC
jgi:hypothetical protein